MSENPLTRAREAMQAPRLRRFYTGVAVARMDTRHTVLLDGRELRTPARRRLELPTSRLAEALADEWHAQGEFIEPDTMPLTRLANSAFDGVADATAEVATDIARHALSDLLCYRAPSPAGLAERQRAHWDPPLRWANAGLGLELRTADGIVHVDQPAQTEARMHALLAQCDCLRLAALHVMTTLTGSAVLALAVHHRYMTAGAAWEAAHVDEDWQAGQWGEDPEAARRRARRWRDMEAAARLIDLAGP